MCNLTLLLKINTDSLVQSEYLMSIYWRKYVITSSFHKDQKCSPYVFLQLFRLFLFVMGMDESGNEIAELN